MTEEGEVPEELTSLYAHISRVFNSSVSVFTAVLFGWVTFFGFILNITSSQTTNLLPFFLKVIFICGVFIIGSSAFYFYIRILRLGRFATRIENDLNLRNYINDLPRLRICGYTIFHWLERAAGRPNDDPERWSRVEIVASIVLILFFLITTSILLKNIMTYK